ncbi:MAG TPA: type VI secretion system baseplate subunit TssG [Vicinamibacterales bacterium]|nr:type VI secretion system baseplate subunit TssG [Vicinamibacterales bacterium]
MTKPGWRGDVGLEQWLLDDAHAFDFLSAVRLLEMRSRHADVNPGVRLEPVRFHASFRLDFPPSDILDLTIPDDESTPQMTVSFLSLGGIDGPLPAAFSEEILARLSRRDTAVAAFLDIFHHRLVWQLYRIRKAHSAALATDAPDRTETARHLFSLTGIGLPSLAQQLSEPASLLRYAGLLATHPRSAAGLVVMLSDYFDVPMEIEQFAGEWFPIDESQTTRIGANGQNNVLGRSAAIGTRVWVQDAGVRLRIGPLERDEFARFLPGGRDHATLAELIRLYAGPDLHVGVHLVMAREGVSQATLGRTRIGWNSWIGAANADRPDDQVHVQLLPAPHVEGGA